MDNELVVSEAQTKDNSNDKNERETNCYGSLNEFLAADFREEDEIELAQIFAIAYGVDD